jgi:hypothetical protein
MAISLVGSKIHTFANTTSAKVISLTDLTGGIDTAPSSGDLVVIAYARYHTADIALGVDTSGYVERAELYSNDSNDTNLSVSDKVMGGTPDTSVTVSAPTSSTDDNSVTIHVFRGVDTTTPMDVTATTATGGNSLLANPPAITPDTSGAWVYAAGAGANNGISGASFSSSDLTGFISANSDFSKGMTLGAGYYEWSSGSFDPAAFTFSGSDNVSHSWAAVTLALRPAVAQDGSVRDAGVWKPFNMHVRDGGVWKPAAQYVRDGGIWKPTQ